MSIIIVRWNSHFLNPWARPALMRTLRGKVQANQGHVSGPKPMGQTQTWVAKACPPVFSPSLLTQETWVIDHLLACFVYGDQNEAASFFNSSLPLLLHKKKNDDTMNYLNRYCWR